MAEGVLMPKEGITVESCIIGEWKKNVGDPVNVGDVLFTYETDKAEFECESTAAGTLLAKFYEDGDEVPCLANVCAVGNEGDAYEFLKPGAEVPAPAAAPAAEEAAPPAEDAQAPNTVPDDLELLDTFLATAYCQTGTTATGTYTTEHRTLAVNPGIIPYGTHVWLYLEDGTLVGDYYAEDTGGNMLDHPYVIDIYMGTDYDTCIEWGVKRVHVYVEKDAGS